jgi:integrase
MAKREFSDRMLKALKPAKPGQRYEIMDTDIHAKGLGVRVTAAGTKTFVLVRRFPGSPNPVRRELGKYGELSLAEARQKASGWIAMIRVGKDPKHEEERARLAEARKRANTFTQVAEDFIAEKLPGERQGREVERDIRREFLKRWAEQPIAEITDEDVLLLIREIKKRAPTQARNLLATARRLFAWAIDQRSYGLKANPCADLRPSKIIGDKISRTNILSEDELHAYQRAARRTPYPFGPLHQMLLLTGLRLNEAADAQWSEFDLKSGIWIIPSNRMKGRPNRVTAHVVPLTDDIRALLDRLPRFKTGPYLFSTTFGATPVWLTTVVKQRLDRRMLRTLRALARLRGDDPSRVKLSFVNHDVRRSLASGLAALRIPRDVREAVLHHTPPGIVGTYDRYEYLDEKKHALEAWARRLRSIVEPAPPADNVVSLQAAR